MKKILLVCTFIFSLLLLSESSIGQSVGDYRTRAAGSWNNTSGWQVYQILIGWTNTANIPNNTNGAITIQHAITISGGLVVNADQMTISSAGTLTISDGTLNLYNGSGNDLNINGILTLNNSAAVINAPSGTAIITAFSGTVNLNSGTLGTGVFLYNYNTTSLNIVQSFGVTFTLNGTIYNFSPNAIWNPTTTTLVIGTNGYFEVEPAGTLTITGSGVASIGGASSAARTGAFGNYGTVTKSSAATLNINTTNFYNYGVFQVTTTASTVNLNAAGNSAGTFAATVAGSIINYDVASKNIYAGTAFTGLGTHNINATIQFIENGTNYFSIGSTMNFNTQATIPVDIYISNATLNCNKGVSFDGPGYAYFSNTNSINVGANGSFSTAVDDTMDVTASFSSTTLNVNNSITVGGPMIVQGATINGAGTINFSGARLTSSGTIQNGNFKFNGLALQTVVGSSGRIATVEIDNPNDVSFFYNQNITSSITFTRGKVDIADRLFMPGTAAINGYNSSKYFYGYGLLKRTMLPSTTYTFPIGTFTDYLPLTITTAATFVADTVMAAIDYYDFYSNYSSFLTPTGANVSSHIVTPVWRIQESTAAGSNFSSIRLQWNKLNEEYAFNRTLCGVVRNSGSTWSTPIAGAASGTDPYTRTSAAITLGGSKAELFGVADNAVNYTINTLTSASQFRNICAGGTLTFSFSVTDSSSIAAGNVFTAQLSNAFGSFASPVNIGSVTARGGRNLTVTIPAGTAVGDYSIRMISSNPLLVEEMNYMHYYNQRVSVRSNCYCSGPLSTVACTYYISNVTIGDINRSSVCENGSGLAYSSFGNENYDYMDYAPMTTTLIRGLASTLRVTTNLASVVSAWIDYNRNGVYEASEWTQVSALSAAGVASVVSITPPLTASIGITGMRIRTRSNGSNGAADACTLFGSGETEEYFVYIADDFVNSSHTPSSNNTCVSASFSPSLTYNSAIKYSSVNSSNYYLQGSISGIKSAVLSGGGTSTITINPSQNFEAGEQISVVASGANIEDTSRQVVSEYCYQFIAGASVAPKTFKRQRLTGTGTSVINTYAADFNKDGISDLLEVNSGSLQLALSRGIGNGTFAAATYINTPGSPYSAAIADYDLDGDMDIAVAYGSKYKIDLYFNNGASVFSGPISITASHRPRVIVPFYVMDNDAPSILSANYLDSTVSVFENTGNGIMSEISRRSVGAAVQAVVAGDFNQNGILDVAATTNGNKIAILEFVTRKSLTLRSLFSSGGTNPIDIKTADLNGDGDLDLVWSNFSSSNLGYVRGTAGLGFDTANVTLVTSSAFPFRVALADYDGDCDIDVACSNAAAADFSLFANTSGTLNSYGGPKGNSPAGYVVAFASADFDEDGDIDLVASSVSYNSKSFLENKSYTIQTGSVTGPICNNASTTVTWTVSDTLPSDNIFYVQLSDINGSFASPTVLDTVAGIFSSSGTFIMPTVTAGTTYRIRVISNYVGITYFDNGANIAIGASPANPNINFACSGTSTVLSATGGTTYTWSPATYLSSATGSPVTATPAITQVITMVAKDVAGCSSAARTASIGPTCYCYPNYSNNTCNNDYISSVILNTLNYSSSNCGGNDNNTTINYYTTITPNVATDLNRLSNYNLSLTAGAANPQGFGVWIDYNKDGDYDDAGEFVYASPSTANQTFTGSITIPGTATLGVTRMRVMITRGSLVTSTQNCATTLPRGEVQDFYIRINGCTTPTVYTLSGGGNICAAQSTSVNLSGSASGVTYALYRNSTATGTTLSGTGSALAFSGISTVGTYSIYATNTQGCSIKMQDSVSVNLVSNPSTANAGSDQTRCGQTSTPLTANAPTSGTGSWSIVSGSGGSFSSTTNPVATFTAAAGSTNTLRWTISNAPCTATSDDVVISFPLNPTTANAGPDQSNLCGLTSATLAANTATAGTGAWSIVSGTGGSFSNASSASSTFIGTAGSSYVLRWTISNSTCTPSIDDVSITFPRNPSTANAGPGQTLCGSTSTTLAGNTPSVGTGTWSIFSGTGGSLGTATSPISSFTGLAGNTYVLFWTISNAPCIASADSMVVSFPRNPTNANAGPDQLLCGLTTATLAANTPSVGSGLWTKVSGAGGSFSNASSATSNFTGTAGISYVLRWTISNSPCVSSSEDVTINFALNPTTAFAGNDTNICNGSTINLKANAPTNGTGLWTILSGAGNIANTASPTTTASAFTNNTSTSLIWTISNGTCPPSRDTVRINSNASFCAATLADFAANTTSTCTGSTITFTDLSSNATSWSWNFGANASPATANTQGPHTVSYTITGNKTVALTATGPGGSDTKTKTNYISVITTPGAPTGISGNTSICAGTNAVVYSISAVAFASSYVWTVPTGAVIASGNGTISITVNYSGAAISGNVSVYATNACGNGSPANLAISVSQPPSAALAGPDQLNICGTTSAILAANTPAVGSGIWTIVSGGAGTFTNSSSASSSFSGSAGTSYTLRWTISNAPCTATSDEVVVTFNQNPTTANAGSDQTSLCGLTSATLGGNTPTVGTGLWSIVSGTGGSFSNASAANSVFVGTAGSSYTLRWTISNAPCATSSDDVLITFPLNPSIANAGTDQTNCGLTSATLAAATPAVGTGLWTVVSGAGGTFVNTSSATSGFTGVAGTTYTIRWTISNSPCTASTDDVIIGFPQNPSTANAGTDQLSLCGTNSTSLASNTPTAGTGLWTIISGGTGSFGNTTSANSTFTGTIGNTYTLRWTITNNPCGNSSDDVVVSFNQNPSVSNAGADQTLCGATSASLSANTPALGTGSWSIISGSGGNILSSASPTTTFTGAAGNSYTLRWTISNSPCGSSSDDVSISFPLNPTVSNAGTDQNICGVTTANLSANVPVTGTGLWTKISGAGGSFSNASSATSNFTGTAGVTYTLRWTISNSPCTSSNDDVLISFNQNPSISSAGTDQTLCGASAALLAANIPTSGSGLWSIISGAGGSLTTPSSASSNFTGVSGNTYTLRWTITNSTCTPSTDDVVISFPQNPTSSNAGADLSSCGLTTVSLNANTPVVGNGIWTIVSGTGGSFSAATSPLSNFTGVAGANYILRWTISNSPCASSSDDIAVSILQPPTAAFAGNDTTICNGSSITLSANTPIVGAGKWTIASGAASLNLITSPNALASGFVVDTTTTLVWTISTANVCPDSRDTLIVSSNTSVCIVTLADFSVDTTVVCVGSNLTFTDASNQATSWNWNFGAGATPATITGVGPHSVSYSSAGLKTISLTVSGPGGTDTKTKTNLVEVRQAPSAASAITGLSIVCAGQNAVNYAINPIANADAYNWLLPTGASINSFNQNSITVDYGTNAISGNINVEAANGCGTGASSSLAITVNELPQSASAIVGNDTVCDASSAVNYSTAAITSATWYKWNLSSGLSSVSGSDSTSLPQIDLNFAPGLSSATIQVTGYNSCGAASASSVFSIFVAPYPAAAGSISGATVVSACANQNGISYSVPSITNATGYNWTLPLQASIVGGAGTNFILVDYAPTSASGNVTVTGVNACGTGSSANLFVDFNAIPLTEICYATVDSATIKSILYWQRPTESYVDSFVIYHDPIGGSNLTRIAAIKNSINIPTSFLDNSSFPIISPISYQIATKDSCNNQLSLSATIVHKTINLNGTLGWSGVAKLYWNEYLGITDPVRYYSVLRDTTGVGPFDDTLATNILPAPNMAYTDVNSFNYPNCRYVIVMNFSTDCNKDARVMAIKSTSRSNIKNRAAMAPDAIGATEGDEFSAMLFPNPAKGLAYVALYGHEKNYTIRMTDLLGQEIFRSDVKAKVADKTTIELPLEQMAPGIYFVTIENDKHIRKTLKLKVE